jgi:hypothetical protein
MSQKMQYGEALYWAVQRSLYQRFGLIGALAELGAVASLVTLSFLTRKQGIAFYLTLSATICVAAGLAVWFAFVSPANSQVAQWTNVPLPANWMDVRRQWEYGHAASAVLDLVGFAALLLSLVLDTPSAQRVTG